jgi:hypothetical protein
MKNKVEAKDLLTTHSEDESREQKAWTNRNEMREK